MSGRHETTFPGQFRQNLLCRNLERYLETFAFNHVLESQRRIAKHAGRIHDGLINNIQPIQSRGFSHGNFTESSLALARLLYRSSVAASLDQILLSV